MAGIDDNALVKMRTLRAMLSDLARMIPRPGPGLGLRVGKDGPVWGVNAASLAAAALTNLSVSADGTITSGLIGGVMPTIGGTPLSGSYTPLSLTGSGTEHVICTITSTLSKSGSTFVETIDVTSAAFSVGADPGSSGLVSGDGTFVLLWATFLDGVKTFQTAPGDWSVDVIDRRDASGECTLVRVFS